MFVGMILGFLLTIDNELSERQFRAWALLMGLPMALILALEELLSAWPTATVVVSIVAFAVGRP